MVSLDLRLLVRLLGGCCHGALEAAAGLAVFRSNYEIVLEHWLVKLADETNNDLSIILRHCEIDHSRFVADLNKSLDRLKIGNSRAPGLSPEVVEAMKQAWLLASVEHGGQQIRSGHILMAILADETLGRYVREAAPLLNKIQIDSVRQELSSIVKNSVESGGQAKEPSGYAEDESALIVPKRAEALSLYTYDLTARASEGKIDPIIGRDQEIRQMVDILVRRRQNNPILTGEAGVGKTAVVEGLALKIISGDVPEAIKGVTLRVLDLALLQAGASMKGEFEQRLRAVIDEVKSSAKPIILFIDEVHTLIGAGGAAGQNDAANLLKPALARGELRTIAATTWAEYKKYFEKDAALTRRFQVVKVEEPSQVEAIAMIRGLTHTLEQHHNTRILDEAVIEAVRLSSRFIPSRQLPDKAISLIDTACARVSMSKAAIPASMEDKMRRVRLIDTEIDILEREMAVGSGHEARLADLYTEKAALQKALIELDVRFEKEKALVAEIDLVRQQIEGPESEKDKAFLQKKYKDLSEILHILQGEEPLIFPVVDGQVIAEVVKNWTGVPTGRMQSSEINTVLKLKEAMEERVVGQPYAMESVAQAIRTSRAKLTDPRKPVGVFLMVGTSGTGKTETALTLANLLYGGEQSMTTINMTEFKEEHKVSLLMGSPPGYIGYGEGGILTEAVRRRPYSVILLDEIEKAHPGVQDVFFQVFDKGNMKDGEGRDIDFKNTVIIMTSNVGTDLISKLCADPETAPDPEALIEALRPELEKHFKPAFLGRVVLVPYFPLSDDTIRRIIKIQMDKIKERVQQAYKANFTYDPELVEIISARCQETSSGARNVEKILSGGLLPELSTEVLVRIAAGEGVSSISVGVGPAGEYVYRLS